MKKLLFFILVFGLSISVATLYSCKVSKESKETTIEKNTDEKKKTNYAEEDITDSEEEMKPEEVE